MAYLVVPVPGWGFLAAGRPLTWLGLGAVATTLWLWWSRRRVPLAALLVVALAVKLVAVPVVAPRGFQASYHAAADWHGRVEPGSAGAEFTRVDDRLRFGGVSADLPLHFFNDSGRFNFYQPGEPSREKLAFSVSWLGTMAQPADDDRQLYLVAPGATARVSVGDASPIVVPDAPPEWTTRVHVRSGWQTIHLEVSVPYGAPRRFEAGWIRDGRHEPFNSSEIFQRPVPPWRIVTDRILRALAWGFDLLWLAALAAGVIGGIARAVHASRHPEAPTDLAADSWSTLIVATVIADAALFALPAVNRLALQGGGGDPLAYETMAREILLGGPLMTGGRALGEGQPYYYHPFYPYFLAACHWLTGEGVFGIHFIQRLLLGITVIFLWRTTAALFGEPTGRVGLAVASVVVYERIAAWAGSLLGDVLFIPLFCGWAAALVAMAAGRTRRPAAAVVAGGAWGLAILTRGTPLLGLFAVLPVFVVALARRHGTWWRPTLLLVGTMLAVVSLATVRNYIVAGRVVPIFTSGSASLALGNPPPPTVRLGPGPRDPYYRRLGFDDGTRGVAEFAIQQPATFARGLWRKALYMLGWFTPLVPSAGWSVFLIACSVTAGCGALMVAFRRGPYSQAGAALALPAAVALVHVASAIVIFPHVYGDRLILPIYAVLVPYMAAAVATAWAAVTRGLGRVTLARAFIGGALAMCLLELAWPGRLDFDFDVLLLLMVVGAWTIGARFDRGPRPWAFAVFAAALSVTLLSAPTADAVEEYRRQLAVPALALVMAGLVAAAELHRGSLHRRDDRWMSAAVLAGSVLLTTFLLQWISRPTTTLQDGLSLYAWRWTNGGGSVLAGHEWFGVGLAGGPPLADIRMPTLGAGGVVLWFLVATGGLGAASYVAVWARALWISARQPGRLAAVALNGVLMGVFAVSQRHNLLAGSTRSAALLSLIGLVFGFLEATHHDWTEPV